MPQGPALIGGGVFGNVFEAAHSVNIPCVIHMLGNSIVSLFDRHYPQSVLNSYVLSIVFIIVSNMS